MSVPSQLPRHCWLLDLPLTDYAMVLKLQHDLVAARKKGAGIDRDIVIMVEHPPVYTLGRRGGLENLTVSDEFLAQRNIRVVQAERGGDITYHGPGQLVCYPIVSLRAARLSVTDFVEGLETVMIRTAAEWGVSCERNPLNRGVWVGNCKLGSIGICVRHGVSFHGLALNANNAMDPFGWINPCGLHGVGMTSIAMQIGREISFPRLRTAAAGHMEAVFSIRLERIELAEVRTLLAEPLVEVENLKEKTDET